MFKLLLVLFSLFIMYSCANASSNNKSMETKDMGYEIEKTPDEWKSILSKDEYYILREKGTERAFSGKYDKFYEEGLYLCKACDNKLFSSTTKFSSGTGWPSFYDPIGEHKIREIKDYTFGMIRTEVVCNRCGSHLGHVFNDGPKPSNLRYCINSKSLKFSPKEELGESAALREE